ncbi:MAG TPA: hypothetical protein VGV12_05875 [Gemmatimonadales bacterium]|nr:hypothetical protein [Gemmatimonadales bacterium]
MGGYTSLDPATDAGCATFPANASSIDSAEYLVLAHSTGGNPGGSAAFTLVNLTPSPTAPPAKAMIVRSGMIAGSGPRSAAVAFDRYLRSLGRTHAASLRPAARAPAAASVPATITPPTVGSLRTFTVCDNRATCEFASDFKKVGARALAVGAHVAIYVDTLAPPNGLDSADIDTLKQVFDARLYPLATDTFGAASDLDSNGVVIALMTPVVNSLVTAAQCGSGGYIAGFFFPPDLIPGVPAFQTNGGEIFYSIVADPSGTVSCAHTSADVKRILPSTFVHEFQHMINFAQHVLFRPGLSTEDGWLDEGLAKYAEELAARSYLPGDPTTFHAYLDDGDLDDASLYLTRTDTAFLLIPFDNGTLADVGASWLFVRYLMDQSPGGLAGKLVQTTLFGETNVATQTGQNFSTLVARWALANWVSDLPGFTPPPELTYTSWSFRAEFDSLHTKFPTHFPPNYPLAPVAVGGAQVHVTGKLNAGSGIYVRALQGPAALPFTLSLTGPNPTQFTSVVPRLTIIRIR